MSHIKYRRALVENLVDDVRNQRKRSLPGSVEREERLNTVPHFLYRYEKKEHKNCIVCRIGRSREPEKKNTSIVIPV
jgi:hypothetical protein